MKRIFLIVLIVFSCFYVQGYAADEPFEQYKVILKNDKVYFPLKSICEEIGAEVTSSEDNKEITVKYKGTYYYFEIATINDVYEDMNSDKLVLLLRLQKNDDDFIGLDEWGFPGICIELNGEIYVKDYPMENFFNNYIKNCKLYVDKENNVATIMTRGWKDKQEIYTFPIYSTELPKEYLVNTQIYTNISKKIIETVIFMLSR